MTCHSERRKYLVGIKYESPYDDRGYFDIERLVTLQELAEEVCEFQLNGHHFPTFPPSANPSVLFAWDLDDPDDGDCTPELTAALERTRSKADFLQKR